jgi:hypothetical protein
MTPLNSEIQALGGHATADFFADSHGHSDSGNGLLYAPARERQPQSPNAERGIFAHRSPRRPGVPITRCDNPTAALTKLVPN